VKREDASVKRNAVRPCSFFSPHSLLKIKRFELFTYVLPLADVSDKSGQTQQAQQAQQLHEPKYPQRPPYTKRTIQCPKIRYADN